MFVRRYLKVLSGCFRDFFLRRGGVDIHGRRVVLGFSFVLAFLVVFYSVIFHWIMSYEGRDFSWVTGFYWTLTTMSTLGFGDIVFQSDLGRVFSVFVLCSGVVLLLVLMPFVFLRFVYIPFLEGQRKARAWGAVSGSLSGHVIFTSSDGVSCEMASLCLFLGVPVVFLVASEGEVSRLELEFRGAVLVLCGRLDSPEIYRRSSVDRASMVVCMNEDFLSATIAVTVRQVSQTVCLVSNADFVESVEILSLAGYTHVFEFHKELAKCLGEHLVGVMPVVLGRFGDLLVAEWRGFSGKKGETLRDLCIGLPSGVVVLGVWERGVFEPWSSGPLFLDRGVDVDTSLLLCGSAEDLRGLSGSSSLSGSVLILGAGRVGTALSEILGAYGRPCTLVEKAGPSVFSGRFVRGDAASPEVLRDAGIFSASSVVVTTHEEDWNVYLTIFCRKLRPDVYILARSLSSDKERVFYTVGADLAMSYSFVASRLVLGWLRPEDFLLLPGGVMVVSYLLPVGMSSPEAFLPFSCTPMAVFRDGVWEVCRGSLSVGEQVLVVGTLEGHTLLRRFFLAS